MCQLPLDVGSITVKAMRPPLAAGPIIASTGVKMSSLIPVSLAKANRYITSVSDTGAKLFCMDVLTEKADSLESLAEEFNAANNGGEAQVPETLEGCFLDGCASGSHMVVNV